MRRTRMLLGLPLLAFLAVPPTATAQPSTTPTYTVHRAIKVNPQKRADFEKFYSGTLKKYHMARKNAGAELGWSLTKVVLPSGAEALYNYISTSYYDKFPPLDPPPGEGAPFIEKAGTMPEKFGAAIRDLGTLVRTSISVRLEMLGNIEPGDFMRLDYMKTAPGKGSDYVNLERTVYKALHEQRMQQGFISAWTLNAIVFPGGSERGYDFYTTNAVKKSADFGAPNSGYGAALFAKVHPTLNYVSIMNRTPELRTVVNTRFVRVLEMMR